MLKSPVFPDLEWYVMSYGIAIDIGTSGIRAQAIDLTSRKIISTAITLRHPLPGANVMDHLHFVIETSMDLAHSLVIDAINRLLHSLEVDLNRVERIAVSGNPTQLSIFQGIEIRDLAYWGEDFLKRKGIEAPPRAGDVVEAGKLGLKVRPEAEVYIPPAIKHEVGADALAMLVETGVLNKRGDLPSSGLWDQRRDSLINRWRSVHVFSSRRTCH
jgi:methylamine methyltransferase corrinoid protein reductive activase